jgi:hypothetical protein
MTLSWGDVAPKDLEKPPRASRDGGLERWLAALALAIARRSDVWRPVVRHDADLRWHGRLATLDDVEVWLLGWTHAQDVELHDHGGSSGAFAVAEGELCEQHTELGARGALRTAFCPAGIARSFGPGRIHHVSNHASAPATSIHVYSPPLDAMRFYDLAPDGAPRPVRVERILPGDGAAADDAALARASSMESER